MWEALEGRSEDKKGAFSLLLEGPRGGTEAVRLGSKCADLLSSLYFGSSVFLAGPRLYLFHALAPCDPRDLFYSNLPRQVAQLRVQICPSAF